MEDRQEFQGVNIRLKRSRPRTGNGNHEETAKEVPDVFSRLEYCAQHDPHTHSNSKQRNSRTDRSYDYYAPSYHYRSSRSPDRSSYHHPSYRYSSSSNKSGYAVSSYDYEKSRSRSKSSHHPDTSREGQYNNGDISPSTSGRQKSPPKRSDTKTAPTDPRKRPVPTPDQTETDIKRSKTDGIKKDGTDEDQGITSNSKENGKDNTQTSGDMGLATNDQMAKDDGKLDTAKNSHDDSIIKSPNRATTMPEMKNITTGISSATPSVENTTSMTTSATPSAENTAPMIISTSPMTTGATCTTPMTTSTTRPAPMTISATPITTSTIASTTSTAPVTTTNVSATLDLPATTGEELLPLTKAPLTSISTSTTPSLSSQTTNNKQTDQEINTIKQSTSINSNHIAGEPPHLQPTTSVSGQLHNVTASQQTPLSFINIADEKTVIQLICVGTAIQPNAIGHLEDYLTLHLPKLKCRTMVFPAGLASREDVLKQVHMDGVNALLLLENGFEEHGKVFLQVYDQQHGGKDSLHFDEYEGISVIDAVYIIQQAIQKTKEITSPTTIPATATPLSFLNRGSPSTVKAEPLAMQPYSLPEQQTQLQEKHQAQIQVQQQQQIAADLIQQLNHKSGGPSTMTNSGLTPPPAAAAAGVTALTLNAPTGQVSPASTAITLYDNSPDVNQSNLCLLSKVLDYLANSEQQQYTLGSYNSRRTIILQTLMNMKTFQPPLRPEQEYAVSSNLIMYLQRLNPPHPPAPIYQTHWQYGPSSSSGPYYNIH
ncbi:hypothetical protein BC941DRAFT_215856 [Chlamydoabsidia padenii]|nr:hypothetical protein BC941DRAFT_215856 [Chlamydoabsidia padenii]